MTNLISNIRDWFDRPTRSEIMTLARKASSRKGLKLTAQLLQQSDSLTKKDIADWRNAHQMAIDYENPNRSRLYDIYGDAVLDAHLSGCIGQRKGKTLQKDFRLVGQDGKENAEATELLQQEWFSDFMDLALDSRFWGPTLIQMGDIVNDENGIMRYDGVELVPRKHVVPEYGVVVKSPGDDWRGGISYVEGDFANWVIPVGKGRDLGLLLKCCPSCISKKICWRSGICSAKFSVYLCVWLTLQAPTKRNAEGWKMHSKPWVRLSGVCSRKEPTLKLKRQAGAMLTTYMTNG